MKLIGIGHLTCSPIKKIFHWTSKCVAAPLKATSAQYAAYFCESGFRGMPPPIKKIF
jgi:hypothetical protein